MRKHHLFSSQVSLIIVVFVALQAEAAAALTALLSFDPLRSEMSFEVSWDRPLIQVALTGTGTVPTDPLTGLRMGENVIWDGYSSNGLLGQNVGDYVIDLYDADILFDQFHGVSSTLPDFGLFIDHDDAAGGDDFYVAVRLGTIVPDSGSFKLTASAPEVGFPSVFNFGTFSGGDTTLAVRRVPEPSTAIFGGLALFLGAMVRHRKGSPNRVGDRFEPSPP